MAYHRRKHHRGRGHNPRSYHRRRRHHNPFGVSGQLLTEAAWAVAGGVLARSVPQAILGANNSSWTGYAANAITTLGVGFFGGKMFGGTAGDGLIIGGLVATISRVISDKFGAMGGLLAGDPAFHLGTYVNSSFAVPTASDAYGRVTSSPYPIPLPPPSARMGAATPDRGRYRGRYS